MCPHVVFRFAVIKLNKTVKSVFPKPCSFYKRCMGLLLCVQLFIKMNNKKHPWNVLPKRRSVERPFYTLMGKPVKHPFLGRRNQSPFPFDFRHFSGLSTNSVFGQKKSLCQDHSQHRLLPSLLFSCSSWGVLLQLPPPGSPGYQAPPPASCHRQFSPSSISESSAPAEPVRVARLHVPLSP